MADSPTLNSYDPLNVALTADGAAVADTVQLVSVTVTKALNSVPTAKIVIYDGDMPDKDFPVSNEATFKPGAEIEVKVGYGDADKSIFKGVVVRHGIKIGSCNDATLVLECKDKAFAMTVGRKNATYEDKKDSEIITSLISASSGLSSDIDATTVQHKELVQYYSSDWDFMLSRAEVNGLLVSIEAAKVSVKKPDTSSAAVLTVTYGSDLMSFQADVDARTQLTEVAGAAWEPKEQKMVEQTVKPQTLNSQGDLTSADLAKVAGLASYGLQTSAVLESDMVKAWATAQQIKSGLARIRGSMSFQGSEKALPGVLIEVAGVGARFNGSVFVSGVTHTIKDGNWLTDVDFGLSPTWATEHVDVVAPSASGLLPGVEGLHIGVVKKLDADPDGRYRIQVTMPVLGAEAKPIWARLAKFYASQEFGSFFIPEINDEVVMGFLNNDPSHPIILGSLYSGKNKPPYELTADNYTKAIVTKTKLKVEFDDENKVITVTTPGENKIVLSDKDKSILIQDQNSNKVELADGGITLDSPKDITINAKGKITISAVGELSASSKADVKVEGLNVNATANVGFTAKGNATAEVSASGQTTIKGAMVMIN